MLQTGRWQGSEQRRQHALHVAEVLQNLSVNRSNVTSCHSPATPKEQRQALEDDHVTQDIS